MKKIALISFTVLCFAMMLIPSVCMLFDKRNERIGNEIEVKLPSIISEDGSFNTKFLPSLGEYFETHFAFRPELITLDGKMQASVFSTSNIPSVVTGKNGWLYYTSSVGDFTGESTLSERQIKGVVHNLEIINEFTERNNAKFIFTVSPNKNTLYGENMPYYYTEGKDEKNRDLLIKELADSRVDFVNLFDLFNNESETLYFKTDSHWNNKGALLAYREISEHTGLPFEDYSSAEVTRKKDFTGDLNKMIFPAGKDTEFNYYYNAEEKYSYVTDTSSVEDPLIIAESKTGTGTLYMFRDSFGNALLPFFASSYASSTFTKAYPTFIETDFAKYNPDIFIMELVERNINFLVTSPPLIRSPEYPYISLSESQGIDIDVNLNENEFLPSYLEISGKIDYYNTDEGTIPFIYLETEGKSAAYECFYYVDADGNDGYMAYVDKGDYENAKSISVSLALFDGDEYRLLGKKQVNYGG